MFKNKKPMLLEIAVYFLILITYGTQLFFELVSFNTNMTYVFLNSFNILVTIFAFIFILIKKRQNGLGISLYFILSAINAIVTTIYFAINDKMGIGYYLIKFLYALFAFAIIITIIVYFRNPSLNLKVTSLVLLGFYTFFEIIGFAVQIGNRYELLTNVTSVTISSILSIAIVILIFIQVIEFYSIQKSPPIALNNFQTDSKSDIDNVDKLLQYKKLLDLGAITQEEFDAKKRELLEL